MDYLKAFLTDEYGKGNYIIVGGDWNQCAAGFSPGAVLKNFDTHNYSLIDRDYLPNDWAWFYDKKTPSNRRLQIPYDPEKSLVTVIDYYLLSPNIEGVFKQTVDLGFQNSDHQPVLATIKLTSAWTKSIFFNTGNRFNLFSYAKICEQAISH